MAKKDDIGPILIAGGAFLILAKWAVDSLPGLPDLPDIPNPIPPIVNAGDELTDGLQKDETETFQEYFFEFDVPFSDDRVTWQDLAPGLTPDRGAAYTTETTGAVAMDIVEPGQTTGEWLTSIDLPGVDPYNLRDAPGDIWRGVQKLNPF
jgi:hypothetical protein